MPCAIQKFANFISESFKNHGHPERSMIFTKWRSCGVEGPLPSPRTPLVGGVPNDQRSPLPKHFARP